MDAAITKVFATPTAYQYITGSSFDDHTTQQVIKRMMLAASGGKKFLHSSGETYRIAWDSVGDYRWPVEIHTREEKTERGLIRTVLLCSLGGDQAEGAAIQHGGDEAFYEAVKNAFEIPFEIVSRVVEIVFHCVLVEAIVTSLLLFR